jgi:hypothetical protein
MRDNEHPFFRPLWRRILLVAVCVGWSIFEFSMLNYKPPAEQPPAAKPEE